MNYKMKCKGGVYNFKKTSLKQKIKTLWQHIINLILS